MLESVTYKKKCGQLSLKRPPLMHEKVVDVVA